jgi:hypothetical protein
MAVQYSPLPTLEVPNVNLLGAYAQGQALQQNALQQQRLQQQMDLAERAAGYTANKDLREAEKLQTEQQAKAFEMASKKYDLLVGMSPRLTPQNYKAWYKEVTTAFPPAASVLNPEYDPEQVKLIPLQAADMKPQLLQQTIGDQTRLLRAGPTGGAEVVPGSEFRAQPEYTEIKQGENIVGYRPKRGMGGIVSPEEFQAGDTYDRYTMSREGTGKNPRSSAEGLGQFIDSTFVSTFRKTFPDQAQGMSREQILAQRGTGVEKQMLPVLRQENIGALKNAGFEPSKGNVYLSHFLGAPDAIDVLGASPDTPVEDLLRPSVLKANPDVFKKVKTAGDLINWAGGAPAAGQKKIEGLREPLQSYRPAPIGTEDYTAQKSALKFLDAIEYDPEAVVRRRCCMVWRARSAFRLLAHVANHGLARGKNRLCSLRLATTWAAVASRTKIAGSLWTPSAASTTRLCRLATVWRALTKRFVCSRTARLFRIKLRRSWSGFRVWRHNAAGRLSVLRRLADKPARRPLLPARLQRLWNIFVRTLT